MGRWRRSLVALTFAASACAADSTPPRERGPKADARSGEAQGAESPVESAWIVARVLEEAPGGTLADPRTTYTLLARTTFTTRAVGGDALAMPEVDSTFRLDLRGRRFVNGYRSFVADQTPLDVGATYLIRLCEGPRFASFTECSGPGHTVLRLVDDDPRMEHPYYIVENSRAVIGWTEHGPAVTESLIPERARRQFLDCLDAPPPELVARLHAKRDDADPDAIFADMPDGDRCDREVDVPFHLHAPPAPEELYSSMRAMRDVVGPAVPASERRVGK